MRRLLKIAFRVALVGLFAYGLLIAIAMTPMMIGLWGYGNITFTGCCYVP